MPPIGLAEGLEQARRHWFWHVLFGVVLIAAGALAFACPLTMTSVTVLFFGWLVLFGGLLQCVLAFQVRAWSGFFLHLLGGVLGAVVGGLMVAAPVKFALILTLLLAAHLIVNGLFRFFGALGMRFDGWGLVALSGLISTGLGVMLVMEWPVSGLWFIGLCVGIDMIFHGATLVAFGLALRKPLSLAQAPASAV